MSLTNSRFKAVIDAMALDWRIHVARKHEAQLVADAGAAIAESTLPIIAKDADAEALRRQIASVAQQINALDVALHDSLAKDRQDYAKATQLMRWIVVARGIFERWLLRDRVRYHRHERQRLAHELGLLPGSGAHELLREAVPGPVRDGIAKVRAEIELARQERTSLLAPWNGQPMPAWLRPMFREIHDFFLHVWKQITAKLFLRVPTLGALLVGWWIAHSYSDSTLEHFQRSLHLGGRSYMDPRTLDRLRFWGPLLAAALCTYLMSAIGNRVQRKYSPPQEESKR